MEQNKKKSNKILILLVCLLTIIIILLAYFSLYNNSRNRISAMNNAESALRNDLQIAGNDYLLIGNGDITVVNSDKYYKIKEKISEGYERKDNDIIICEYTNEYGVVYYDIYEEDNITGGTFYLVVETEFKGTYDFETNTYTYIDDETSYICIYDITNKVWKCSKK